MRNLAAEFQSLPVQITIGDAGTQLTANRDIVQAARLPRPSSRHPLTTPLEPSRHLVLALTNGPYPLLSLMPPLLCAATSLLSLSPLV